MSQVSRSATYTAQTVIDPDVHNTEHDAFVNANNDNDTRITNLETANMSISGIKTLVDVWKFMQGLWSDTIYERSAGAGVTIDPSTNNGVKIKDGAVYLGDIENQADEDALTLADGAFWYRTDTDKFRGRVNGESKTFALGDAELNKASFIDHRYIPVWASTSGWTFPSGLNAVDSTGQQLLTLTADITASLASSGAGGLDAGSVAASKHYYPFLIGSSTGAKPTSIIWSLVSSNATGPTLPSGYDRWRRLNMCATTDSGSNVLRAWVSAGWPYMTTMYYNTNLESSPFAASTSVLSGGSASSFTTVDLSAFVPAISKEAILWVENKIDNTHTVLRTKGLSHNGEYVGESDDTPFTIHMQTDSTRAIEYKKFNGGTVNIALKGFVVTEPA